jgi:hypothetical protein
MDVFVCSTYVTKVKGLYMGPIKVGVHSEANLCQAQVGHMLMQGR